MNILERNLGVLMVNEQLAAVPFVEMPDGFAMRWFAPGDEATWVRVQQAAEKYQPIDEALFFNQFGEDETRLSQGVGFLIDESGAAIGTISAWNDKEYSGREYSRMTLTAI